ncbi:MAG: helix-turn-helix transcriptional regulator [Candidatus Aenigmarchaeota archaeon]|nr:helix-turn-helix transcriptional regulator [Candidatus Aenigmarchaeota archaeon]
MVNKWELAGKVHASSYRVKVLSRLAETPRMPTQLSKELDIKMSHISRTIRELVNSGLVESLTPDLRKSRVYGITRVGKEVLEKAKELEK